MQGTKIGFATRVPTRRELENCVHVDMTSKHPWDPRRVHLEEVVTEKDDAGNEMMDDLMSNLKELLISKVNVECQASEVQQEVARGTDVPSKRTFVSTDRHMKLTADLLADRFGIGPSRARATLG
eukprot:scaffold5568_cov59-Cylindrotheca_fusiformis.AAC.1